MPAEDRHSDRDSRAERGHSGHSRRSGAMGSGSVTFQLGNLKEVPALLKIVEIIFLIIIIAVAQSQYLASGFGPNRDGHCFGCGIVVGYLLFFLILVICYAIGETDSQKSKFELIVNAVGFILFLALAIYLFVKSSESIDYKYDIKTRLIVEGLFSLLVALCQLYNAYIIFKG